jgi:hypothetical protein
VRRKEDLKIDDVVMGKFTKKMVSNWVGNNTQNANAGVNQSNSFGTGISNNSFQSGPNTSKNISGINKSYMSTSGTSNKFNNQKNRT